MEPGDKIFLPSTGKIDERYVITILGYDKDNKSTPNSPSQKTQSHQAPRVKSAPITAVNPIHHATAPIETAIYTEGQDFEGGHKFDKWHNLGMNGTKMIYAEKTPNGTLVACTGVISGIPNQSNKQWNTFLYGSIPKQKITETDIANYFKSLEKKADSLGISFKDDPISEIFETSGKKRELKFKDIQDDKTKKPIYFVSKDTNPVALITDAINNGAKSVGVNLSQNETHVPVDVTYQYGVPLKKRTRLEPPIAEKKKSIFDKLLNEIHKY